MELRSAMTISSDAPPTSLGTAILVGAHAAVATTRTTRPRPTSSREHAIVILPLWKRPQSVSPVGPGDATPVTEVDTDSSNSTSRPSRHERKDPRLDEDVVDSGGGGRRARQ